MERKRYRENDSGEREKEGDRKRARVKARYTNRETDR